MTEQQAKKHVQILQDRLSSLITRVTFSNLSEKENRRALQEINRLTLVLNKN